jgi:hypothetical protein
MSVFIIATKDPKMDEVLKERIAKQFPADYYDIGRGQWLVAYNGTAKALFTELTEDKQPVVKGTVVFGIGGYYGFAARDMWEWVATKLGGKLA